MIRDLNPVQENLAESQNGVHGRPDFMTHFGEKFAFGSVCFFGKFSGKFQSQRLLLQEPVLLLDFQMGSDP